MTSVWKLEDAKARFSEVVRQARTQGPQRVTIRGRETAVILSVEDFQRLSSEGAEARPSLVQFLEGLGLNDLDLTRDRDAGRDPVL